jgi:hypothetical protein
MITDTKLTSKQAFWLEHIQAASRTSQSLCAYAQAQGLNIKQIYYWNKVLRQRGHLDSDTVKPTPRLFHKAHLTPVSTCRVILPTGVILELDTPVEPTWLSQLLAALA